VDGFGALRVRVILDVYVVDSSRLAIDGGTRFCVCGADGLRILNMQVFCSDAMAGRQVNGWLHE